MISRFIFPGGELDYVGLTATNLERHGFEIHDVDNPDDAEKSDKVEKPDKTDGAD